MKQFFSTKYHAGVVNFWLLIYRVAAGSFMLTHGYPKFAKLISGKAIEFADPFGLGAHASFVLAVFAEFFCSILIILGLGTRIASLFIIATMSVAVLHAHAADPFAKKELPLLFLLIFLSVLVFGAGKYSIDHAIAGGSKLGRRR